VDYARIYNLKTVVFRQSCIYGPHQFGVEDQGWVAWFIICAICGKKITIYGDGRQARDILYIDDLIDCYSASMRKIKNISGKVYNIGGGESNVLSPLKLIHMLRKILHRKVRYVFDEWRPGDQKVFVCDIRKSRHDLGWEPKIKASEGIARLSRWVSENGKLFKKCF
jgi:CDP-paratose 2-epimerase